MDIIDISSIALVIAHGQHQYDNKYYENDLPFLCREKT